jgi:cobalt/nickel transport system permease protein
MDSRTRIFLVGGLVIAVLIAGLFSLFASGEPDGLERIAIDHGFDEAAAGPALDSPLADYAVQGVENESISTALAGVIGVAATLLLTVGVLKVVQKRRRPGPGPST